MALVLRIGKKNSSPWGTPNARHRGEDSRGKPDQQGGDYHLDADLRLKSKLSPVDVTTEKKRTPPHTAKREKESRTKI